MKKFYLLFLIILSICVENIYSQNDYYVGVNGLSGEELRSQLCTIISNNYYSIGYSNRKEHLCEIDDTLGYYWDIYSNCRTENFLICEDFVSSGSTDCAGVNTEHVIPQSFFDENEPMRSDLFHIYPVSAKINGERGNTPYGDAIAGLSGRWEPPLDEYKGDLARTYFYFATRYKNVITGWGNSFDMFSGNNLSQWTITMLLRWHQDDPVSQKEIDRNNKIFDIQNNRNPFIDCPCFAEKIWDSNYSDDCNCFSGPVSAAMNSINAKINISDNIINVTIDNQIINTVTIYDITGKSVYNEKINNTVMTKDIKGIENGVYIINIKLENGVEHSERIIK